MLAVILSRVLKQIKQCFEMLKAIFFDMFDENALRVEIES